MVECNFKRKWDIIRMPDNIPEGAKYECLCAQGRNHRGDCVGEKCIFQQQIKLLKEIKELPPKRWGFYVCGVCGYADIVIDNKEHEYGEDRYVCNHCNAVYPIGKLKMM